MTISVVRLKTTCNKAHYFVLKYDIGAQSPSPYLFSSLMIGASIESRSTSK